MATHLIGGSPTYEYLGQNVDGTYAYRIQITTYINCDPLTSQITELEPFIPVGIYINDASDPEGDKALAEGFDMPLVNDQLITVQLAEDCSIGTDVCVREGQYEFFVDLPLNFDGYWIYYDRCCRNEQVVNATILQGMGFSSFIPSPLVENSAPYFTGAPASFLCAGDTATFLNSAIDPDGDQLIFSFVEPYRGYGDSNNPDPGYFDVLDWPIPELEYEDGFTAEQPFGENGYALINGVSGLTEYMAPNIGQYVIGIEIREYRNGILIGISRRDLQLLVLPCPAQIPPVLNTASQNQGTTVFEVEEGASLCLPIIFSDPEGDSLSFDSFGEVFDMDLVDPVATITEPQAGDSLVQADFCWATTCEQGRSTPYFFGVTAMDDGCPPKSTDAIYTVTVAPFDGASFVDGQTSPCENTTEVYATDEIQDGEYIWTVEGGTITQGQGSDEVTIEWGSVASAGITVIATNGNGCVGDPLDVDVGIQPLPVADAGSDVEICQGDSVQIGGGPTGPAGSLFAWSPSGSMDDGSVANPDAFPSESTDYVVAVMTAAGCSVTDTVSVQVNVVALTHTEDHGICQGDSVLLTAEGGDSYSWSPTDLLMQSDMDSTIAFPTETTTFSVTATTADGCSATGDVTITVLEPPTAMAGADRTSCGLETAMEAEPSVGEGQWTSIDGLVGFSDENDPAATATAQSEGPHAMVWTETNGGVCVSQDTVLVTFIASPETAILNGPLVCGLIEQIEGTLEVGSGQWTTEATELSFDEANEGMTMLSSTSYGTYDIIWSAVHQGCVDSDTLAITFAQPPIVDAGEDENVCSNAFDLSGTVDVGDVSWSGPMEVSFSDPDQLDTEVVTTTAGTYELVLTADNTGCVTVDQVFIEFIVDTPEVDAGEDVDYVCVGDTIQFMATPGFNAYVWTPNLELSSNVVADPFFHPTSNYTQTFTVTVTDIDGCMGQDSLTVTTNINVPTDAGSDTIVCAGDMVVLGGMPTAPDGSVFAWGGGEIDMPSESNPIVYPTETTTYQVATTNAVCTGSDAIEVTVEETSNGLISADTLAQCDGVLLRFSNSGNPNVDHIWDFGDGSGSTDFEPSHLFVYGQEYITTYSTTSPLGCSTESVFDFDADFSDFFQPFFPNVMTPNGDGVNDHLSIDIMGDVDDCLDFEVFNRWGQTVFFSTGSNSRWDGRTQAGEKVMAGTYFYFVRFKGVEHKGSVTVIR